MLDHPMVKSAISGAFIFALAAYFTPANAQVCDEETGAALDLSVTEIEQAEGVITITLYPDDRERFLAKGGRLSRLRVKAEAPVTRTCIPLPAPGTYAIAIYHDANANKKFDRNFIGLPTEGYGFSNDARTNLAPPSFDAVKFDTAKSGITSISIKMRY